MDWDNFGNFIFIRKYSFINTFTAELFLLTIHKLRMTRYLVIRCLLFTAEFYLVNIPKLRMTRYLVICSLAFTAYDEISRHAHFLPYITFYLIISQFNTKNIKFLYRWTYCRPFLGVNIFFSYFLQRAQCQKS